MNPIEVELITFEDDEGSEESWIILERFACGGANYAFMLAMQENNQVLQEDGKPVFMVMREEDESFFDLLKEEEQGVSRYLQKQWEKLNQKIAQLERHAQ